VPGTTVTSAVHEGPLFADAASLLAADAAEAGLVEALLHSVERYQGAAAVGDGAWALVHARQAQDHAAALADQLRVAAPVFETLATSLETQITPADIDLLDDLGQAVDNIFTAGLNPAQSAALGRSGVTRSELAVELSHIAALDLAGFDPAAAADNLRALATDGSALAGQLDTFVTTTQAAVDALVADPAVTDEGPAAHAGGPYTATAGTAIAFNATASSPGDAPIDAYDWDLDGDGDFDDATGANPTALPGPARAGLIGVRVTDTTGLQHIAYAPITVAATAAPTVTSVSPADDGPTVELGSSGAFTFEAAGATTHWYVDGVEAATGASFTFTPEVTDLGARQIRAAAAGVAGTGVARDWTVTVIGPDGDGDGYSPNAPDPAQADCNDADNTVYPGAPELLDEKDNDCNPASPDGGEAPVPEAGEPIAAPEGTAAALVAATLDTADSTAPFSATVDWGDGTTSAATVTGSGTNRTVTASHAYADNGVYAVEVCGHSGTGMASCDQTTATISNAPPAPRFADLFGWTAETLPSTRGAPNWQVADDGLSVFQNQNSNPGFFISDQPLIDAEALVTIGVETTSDDDFVGFLLRIEPGDTTNDEARYLLIDWKQATQDYVGKAYVGLAVSYVWGVPDDADLWGHTDTDAGSGGVVELARAATLGSTPWADNDAYTFRFVYTPDSLRIYVDEQLEFDLDMDSLLADGVTTIGATVGGTFPAGNLGFYNYSQTHVRYSGYQLSAFAAQEGTPRTITAEFADPGTADTHIGRFDFGDLTPEEAAAIEATDGAGTATTTHTYAQDGDYNAQLCLTDDDDGFGCQPIVGRVANLPPTVDAGPDQTGGPEVSLPEATFSDPGVLDTHTATIDWGDGDGPQPVDPADVDSALGRGQVYGTHTYTSPGEYTVAVCVTDDANDTGCDSLVATIAEPGPPAAETIDDVAAFEGDDVDGGAAFTDANTSDAITVAYNWGDGTAGQAPVQAAQGRGTATIAHTFGDDGVYTPTFEVCDDTDRCDTVSFTATISNVAPTVTAATIPATITGRTVAATANFTDPGTADTHTATIDWGDGSTGAATITSGASNGSHQYAAAGTYTVTTCVTDDDGGRGCDSTKVTIEHPDDPTPIETPTPTPTPTPIDLPEGAARYVPVDPARLFDTRVDEPAPGPKGRVGPDSSIDVQVAGRLGIPGDAVSVVLNVTVTDTLSPGFVTVYPTGIERPLASSINNIQAGQTRPNLVTVPLGVDGKITFYALGSVNVLADVAGYYLPGTEAVAAGRFVALNPERLFDTRPGTPASGHKGKLGPGEAIDVEVLGHAGVPTTGVSAVVINLTGTEADAPGFLTAYPTGQSLPLASNVNLSDPGTTAPNLAIVPLGPDGAITVYSSHGTHALGDVTGYITDSTAPVSVEGLFVPIAPERVFDTRDAGGPVAPDGTIDQAIAGTGHIPAGAVGVVLNVTGVDAPSPGFLTAWPTGTAPPLASTLNFWSTPTDTRANAAMLPVGTDGKISFYVLAGGHVLADATGYYIGPEGL